MTVDNQSDIVTNTNIILIDNYNYIKNWMMVI